MTAHVEFSCVLLLRRSMQCWANSALLDCVRSHYTFITISNLRIICVLQPSARDVSAHISRKSAAKCDKHCELQNSVNHENLECALRFQGFPESMPASVSNHLMLKVLRSKSSVCSWCLQACGASASHASDSCFASCWPQSDKSSWYCLHLGILGNCRLGGSSFCIICVGPACPSALRHEVR